MFTLLSGFILHEFKLIKHLNIKHLIVYFLFKQKLEVKSLHTFAITIYYFDANATTKLNT